MSEITSEADFIAAVEAMGTDTTVEIPQSTDQASVNTPEAPSAVDTGATTPDSFTAIDPNSLPEELQPIYKSMQADYTRKQQDAAPYRKLAEQFGGLDQIQEGMQFVAALQDPKNLVQLHSELSDYLQEQGLTKAEADRAAASQLSSEADSDDDDYGFTDPSAEQLRKELDDLKSWKEQMEQERLQAEIEADLARKEAAIRQSNPTYTDDDVNAIYQMAYAFAGDLDAAHKAYETGRQRILSSYSQEKAEVPSGVSSPTGTGSAQAPDTFGSFDDRHDYAKKALQAWYNENK